MTLQERTEKKLKELDEMSNKDVLLSLKINHVPLYTESDITPENESWVRALMKADKIFKELENNDLTK